MADSGLQHQALFWREAGGWVEAAVAFIQDGVRRDEPVSVGISGPAAALLRDMLDGQPLVDFFDMPKLGRNPGRIIPAMLDFADIHAGSPLRYVSEPSWAGRSAAENVEAARHDALVDLAFSGIPAKVMCLYDARGVDTMTLSCAERTHSVVIADGESRSSSRYSGRGIVPPQCDRPLTEPPAGATRLSYLHDLREVRAQVLSCAEEAGLTDGRAADLMLAASEVAANTLRHTRGAGTLRIWRTPGEIVCQVTDSGRIDDPLAGRRRPPFDSSGQGLWVVNQVCDLVELRSGPGGTTVRMHVRL